MRLYHTQAGSQPAQHCSAAVQNAAWPARVNIPAGQQVQLFLYEFQTVCPRAAGSRLRGQSGHE